MLQRSSLFLTILFGSTVRDPQSQLLQSEMPKDPQLQVLRPRLCLSGFLLQFKDREKLKRHFLDLFFSLEEQEIKSFSSWSFRVQ